MTLTLIFKKMRDVMEVQIVEKYKAFGYAWVDVIPGDLPTLIWRKMLRRMKAVLDFGNIILDKGNAIWMSTN